MLTDDEARRLLHQAGETVTVDPAPPIVDERGRRRIWPVLAAAAAVVAVAVATVLITGPKSPDSTPTPPTTDGVQIPSVLGYDLTAAEAALRDAGLSTRVREVPICDRTYVRGTRPAAGTTMTPGTTVVVEVAVPGQGFCIAEEQLALDLLAFADGRGPVPPLATTLTLYDGSGDQSTISAGQAADPEAWRLCDASGTCRSFLAELSEAAHRFYPVGVNGKTRYQSPLLTTWPTDDCAFQAAPTGVQDPQAQIGIAFLVDGIVCTQDFVLDVHRGTDGRITAVGLRDRVAGSPTGEPDAEPEEMIGTAFRDFARGGELPPIADEVDLYLGNAFTGFVTASSAKNQKFWATCTELGEYAGRSCPLSPLEVLAEHSEIDYVDQPSSSCLQQYGRLPSDLRTLDRSRHRAGPGLGRQLHRRLRRPGLHERRR